MSVIVRVWEIEASDQADQAFHQLRKSDAFFSAHGASTLMIWPSSLGGPYESKGSGMDETSGSNIGSLALPAIFS